MSERERGGGGEREREREEVPGYSNRFAVVVILLRAALGCLLHNEAKERVRHIAEEHLHHKENEERDFRVRGGKRSRPQEPRLNLLWRSSPGSQVDQLGRRRS